MSNEALTPQGRLSRLGSLFRKSGERSVNILIDGPNVLRRVNKRQVKLEDIEELAVKLGPIKNRDIFLNNHASSRLVEAMVNSGYHPRICHSDIYVNMAMKALEIANRDASDILLIASRDARVVPILMKLKEKNVETAIVGFEPGFSIALKNVSNHTFEIT